MGLFLNTVPQTVKPNAPQPVVNILRCTPVRILGQYHRLLAEGWNKPRGETEDTRGKKDKEEQG